MLKVCHLLSRHAINIHLSAQVVSWLSDQQVLIILPALGYETD
jgi:hypothetical protein